MIASILILVLSFTVTQPEPRCNVLHVYGQCRIGPYTNNNLDMVLSPGAMVIVKF